MAQEDLHPTSFAPYWQNAVMLHPAESKSDIIVRVTFHSHTVPTLHSTTGRISWHSRLPGILVPNNGTMCHAPHSWVNLVISINCDTRIILLPIHSVVSFTYLLKWKCTSLLNVVSSTQILFDLNHSQNWTQQSVLSPHNSCTKHLIWMKYVMLHYSVYSCLWKCIFRCRFVLWYLNCDGIINPLSPLMPAWVLG